MIISLDTECTGLDSAHGAMPFMVSTCDDEGVVRFWEWGVDPLTRRTDVPLDDVADIVELIDAADLVYLQNAKYDVRMLATIGIVVPWPKVRDTLAMGHLLASNLPHNLTWMVLQYLGADIEPHELLVKEVTQECRAIVKRDYPHWRVAVEGAVDMPSVKSSTKRGEDKPWRNDMWLGRALAAQYAVEKREVPNLRWIDACSCYGNADPEHTLPLGLEMERIIRDRGYWAIYEHRLHLVRVACEMEQYGVTAIGDYTEATIGEYRRMDADAERELVEIAADYGHALELAAGASLNDNMRDFFYGAVHQRCPKCGHDKRVKHWNGEEATDAACPKCEKRKKSPARVLMTTERNDGLGLKVMRGKKTGNASMDKDAVQNYLTTSDGAAYDFLKVLTAKRRRGTDLSYMEGYRRFWLPVPGAPGYFRLHPSLNPFGTDHLRWASNSPNLQNVGKGSDDDCVQCDGAGCPSCGNTGKERASVRSCFGPAPGREWYTMDYQSIERRIPAYEAAEPKMIAVFEESDKPPYWGSLYLLTASVLYPDDYWPRAQDKGRFRKEKPQLYKKSKFFDLAKQYGCGRKKGDLLSRVKGSFDLMDEQFPLFAALQAKYLRQAEVTGYVETIPDCTVDPTKGYPILASRTEDGRVLSTTPFNYHVSGTACWAKNKALVRCSDQLAAWRGEGFDGHVALEIHDEILFDFPRGPAPDSNLARAMALKGLMEQSGTDIGIPCPVSVEYHDETWAKGVAI